MKKRPRTAKGILAKAKREARHPADYTARLEAIIRELVK